MKSASVYYHRKSVRLKEYDYSSPGEYFVTICTNGWKCMFGEVVNEEMRLNEIGLIVQEEWLQTAKIRNNVEMDCYVVMPNHIHGIIILNNAGRGTSRRAPTKEQFGKPTPDSIPTIIRLFKSAVTKRINRLREAPGFPVWQRGYYEHIIRNEDELNRTREYIINNPLKWFLDKENPNKGK